MARLLSAFLVLACTFALATVLLYTHPIFSLLGIDPIALDVVNGALDRSKLRSLVLHDRSFTEVGISHLLDVKSIVASVRLGALGLVMIFGLLAWRSTTTLYQGAGLAACLYLVTLVFLATHYVVFGYVQTSDVLHALLFAPGSYVFPAGTLMSLLYSNNDMISGAVFVVTAWGALLLVAWLLCRALRPGV